MKETRPYKAPGIDGIQNKLLKMLPKNALQWLAALYYAYFSLHYFPMAWKTALVVQNSLQNNGYHRQVIQNSIHRHLNPRPKRTVEEHKGIAFLPYINKVTDQISKVLRKSKVKTV